MTFQAYLANKKWVFERVENSGEKTKIEECEVSFITDSTVLVISHLGTGEHFRFDFSYNEFNELGTVDNSQKWTLQTNILFENGLNGMRIFSSDNGAFFVYEQN